MDNYIFINRTQYSREDAFDYLKDTLDNMKCASIEQLSYLLKTNKNITAELLYDYIICYVKYFEINTVSQVCYLLNVRSEYVIDLIEQGKIDLIPCTPEEYLELVVKEKEKIKECELLFKERKRYDAINGLRDAFIEQPKIEEPKHAGYHTNISKEYRRNN